jgi:type IV secretion system protein VirB6
MVAALMLHLVQTFAQQTEALGTGVRNVDAINMLLATVLVFLFLRQVMPIAAGLAGGVGLNSLGAVSRTIRAPLRAAIAAGLAVLGVAS